MGRVGEGNTLKTPPARATCVASRLNARRRQGCCARAATPSARHPPGARCGRSLRADEQTLSSSRFVSTLARQSAGDPAQQPRVGRHRVTRGCGLTVDAKLDDHLSACRGVLRRLLKRGVEERGEEAVEEVMHEVMRTFPASHPPTWMALISWPRPDAPSSSRVTLYLKSWALGSLFSARCLSCVPFVLLRSGGPPPRAVSLPLVENSRQGRAGQGT